MDSEDSQTQRIKTDPQLQKLELRPKIAIAHLSRPVWYHVSERVVLANRQLREAVR